MVRFINRHWEIRGRFGDGPGCDDLRGADVDDGDLLCGGDVHEDSLAVRRQLK
jgi:hypothetical protein